MCSPSWTLLPPPSPHHPSGSSQCTSPKHRYLTCLGKYLCVTMVKNMPANAEDAGVAGSISGSGRSPGVGNGNPLLYSCLEDFMGRGAWWASFHGITKSQTRLSKHSCLLYVPGSWVWKERNHVQLIQSWGILQRMRKKDGGEEFGNIHRHRVGDNSAIIHQAYPWAQKCLEVSPVFLFPP